MKPIIAVGHAALDRVYRVAEMPGGPTKVRALEYVESGGGMAANAAAAIARLGGKVALWSRIGADVAGDQILHFLEADGVEVGNVRMFEAGRSSTSCVIVDNAGERLVIGERDHGMSLDANWLPLGDIDRAGAVLSDLRWVEATIVAFAHAKRAGVPTVLDIDLGAGELPGDLLPLTDYAIFSSAGLDAVAGKGDDAARLLRVLDDGPRHAGVTRGAEGYVWAGAGRTLQVQPAFAVDVVDTTGAGDAFHGAFSFGLVAGLAEAEVARFAAAVAALKCRRLGARAALPSAGEVNEFLLHNRGR